MSSFLEVRTMKEFWAPEAGGLQRALPGLRWKYEGLAESVHGAQLTRPQAVSVTPSCLICASRFLILL